MNSLNVSDFLGTTKHAVYQHGPVLHFLVTPESSNKDAYFYCRHVVMRYSVLISMK